MFVRSMDNDPSPLWEEGLPTKLCHNPYKSKEKLKKEKAERRALLKQAKLAKQAALEKEQTPKVAPIARKASLGEV